VPKRTRIIEDNLNPLFYETLELSFEANSMEDFPPFIFDVYDYDAGPVEDDFLARCFITREEAAVSNNDVIPQPKWHSCHLRPGAPACGEVLASFSIVEEDFAYQIPLNYLNIHENVKE